MSDRIEKTVELKAPVSRVWRALTDHKEFGTWFRAELDVPFVLGKTTRARSIYPGYEHIKWEMRITQMDPERVFAFTGGVYDTKPGDACAADPPTTTTFTLEPIAGGTRLRVVEAGFDKYPPDRRAAAWRGNDEGWDIQMKNIAAHVEPAR